MEKSFPEADVTGYSSLGAGLQNDEKDRHVAAASEKAGPEDAGALFILASGSGCAALTRGAGFSGSAHAKPGLGAEA